MFLPGIGGEEGRDVEDGGGDGVAGGGGGGLGGTVVSAPLLPPQVPQVFAHFCLTDAY